MTHLFICLFVYLFVYVRRSAQQLSHTGRPIYGRNVVRRTVITRSNLSRIAVVSSALADSLFEFSR